MRILQGAFVVAMAVSFPPTGADAQIYTDEAPFLAASGTLDMESFECFPDTPIEGSDPVSAPGFTMSIVPDFGSTLAPMSIYTNPSGSAHATDGNKLVLAGATSTTNGSFTLTITFVAPITEFGMWVTDFGDWTAGNLTIASGSGSFATIGTNPPRRPDGEERFIGIRSPGTPFTTVTLQKSTAGDGVGLDQVYYSNLSPEVCVFTSVAAPTTRSTWSAMKTTYR